MFCTGSKIYSRCFDITMTHHSWEWINIASTLKHKRCKGVTKFVNCECNSWCFTNLFNKSLDTTLSKAHIICIWCKELRTGLIRFLPHFNIFIQCFSEPVGYRYNPIFAAFALSNKYWKILYINIRVFKIKEFFFRIPVYIKVEKMA